jgi:tripartite-type tricarboxylate transporter receptor subunit TctC
MIIKPIVFATMVAVGGSLGAAWPASSQSYPSRPITMIVPFPPGGSTDVIGRIMAERMRALLGQPVIVENVGGAGGSIGVGRVARAAPDGYTLDIGQWDTHVGNGALYPLTYDLQKDLEPIGLLSTNPQLILGRKALPVDDLQGLVAWLKANPDKATQAVQTAGAHVAGVLLQQATATRFAFVPYRGAGPAMQDLVSGHIDLLVTQAAVALPQVRTGAIKAFAVTAKTRSPVVPDIPTVDEGGVPGLYVAGWFGLFAPRGTPRDVVARLNGVLVDALADPGLRARFADLGQELAARDLQTPEGLAAFHKAEIEKWWPIIRAANIKGE